MKTPKILFTACLLASPSPLFAQLLCPAPATPQNNAANAIQASAQHFSARGDGRAQLTGAVELQQGDNRIRAERVVYAPNLNRVQASGNVRYTRCATKNPAWFLAADRFTLDRERKGGTAKNAWLVVGNRPLFYVPRYRVSLAQQRKSGLLSPDIGDSSETGVEFGLPYYLNLAPNQDATVEPRLLSKRGVQLRGNYRYLHRYHSGTLAGDWLDDRDYDERDGTNERYSYSLNHQSTVGDQLRMKLHVQRVSDTDYIEDLSGSFDLISENYVNSQLLADYVWRGWHLELVAENFQRADSDAPRRTELYERQPSVSLSKNLYSPKLNLEIDLRSAWVSFNRKYDTPVTGVMDTEGDRFDHELTLRWPQRRPGFHFTPSAGLRYTHYQLDERDNESRTLPWFSLRAGLLFEKDLGQRRYRSTLEPELFYLHTPRRNQDDLPVFDTALSEFRFTQLFENNRFNGSDRIGDADRLTLALTSRMLHVRSGKEAWRWRIGHTSYFRNREVSLPDENTDENRYAYSDLASEFVLNLNEKLKFSSSWVWDTEDEHPARHATRLSLNAGDNKIINLSNHYLRGETGFSQSELSFNLPLGERWSGFGGWRVDLRSGKDIGFMSGVRYDSCCWSMQLVGQRLLQDVNGDNSSIADGALDYNTMFGIEFNLRGLTSLGVNTDSRILEKWISGYSQ